jgi:hypothetical protein
LREKWIRVDLLSSTLAITMTLSVGNTHDGPSNRSSSIAPSMVAFSLIAGNAGLLFKRGLHPNLETAVGVLWIASDYALRQKNEHPIAAPRLNAAGVILGSLLLSASGIHAHPIDWHRVRTPLGYIPASLTVGFQKELRTAGSRMEGSRRRVVRMCGTVVGRPFTMAALMNAYGVVELARSAIALDDRVLLFISTAYAVATLALPFLDRRNGLSQVQRDSNSEVTA